jgi:hypothetical protein
MLDSLPELFDIAVTLLYAVAGVGLVGGGLLAELRSATTLGHGNLVLGAWLAVMGAVAVVAGAKLFRENVRGRLA